MVGMDPRPRLYDSMLADHLARHRQMAFVSGPRQVGKTTTCRSHADAYANWDDLDHRERILSGPAGLLAGLGLHRLTGKPPVILLVELHKLRRWKLFLKGLFDSHAEEVRILVTGSSRMDTFRRGGDSLMGRYFLYRMHPFSVAETVTRELPDPDRILRAPARVEEPEFQALWVHGGYPEPFLKRDVRFTRRWQSLRLHQLLREDVRDLTRIQQVDQLEMLVRFLDARSSRPVVNSNLARDVRVSGDTLRRWIDALAGLHHGFLVRPWFRNVSRSLRKEPKWLRRDWAGIEDPGDRAETFVGCHLLKAVEGWTDMGLGAFQLAYLRDKEQREVDFLVVRDGKPWFLVEVKLKEDVPGPALRHFQERIGAPFAFQVVVEADYVDADCFARPRGPLVVPARTFLSQLL